MPSKLPAANSCSGSTEGHGANGNLFSMGVLSVVCGFSLKLDAKKHGRRRNKLWERRWIEKPFCFQSILRNSCKKRREKMRWNLKIIKLSKKTWKSSPMVRKGSQRVFRETLVFWTLCYRIGVTMPKMSQTGFSLPNGAKDFVRSAGGRPHPGVC